MATRYYITFHSSSYDTTKRYSSCLQILSKDNLVAIGQDIALKIPMSWSKEKMADYISSYVVSHPEEMVSRQHPDIPWQTKEAMDFHLLLTNKHHRLLGDLELAWGDSRMEDMLNDDSPYCDYSNMEDELYGYLERMIGQSLPQ